MNNIALTPHQVFEFLLNVAPIRPVFIWGAPGIGKSALVQQFANSVGMPCVSLLGSQLAPEDLIGVPQIVDGKSRFCPPVSIARDEPYVLFLDELNACSHEIQKAFYSLIHEKRIGEYFLPEGSVVIGAGNRAHDNAIVKTVSSALLNRMIHITINVSHREWLQWAYENGVHPLVVQYIEARPDHLWSKAPKREEPFSTPRSWHALSDALKNYGDRIGDEYIEALAFGCLTPSHASQFKAFVKQLGSKYKLAALIKGDIDWPHAPEDRDLLYFLSQSFRAQLLKDLPKDKHNNASSKEFCHRAKALLKSLSEISLEMAQLVVAKDDNDEMLPQWFMIEIIRDLPRLAGPKNG